MAAEKKYCIECHRLLSDTQFYTRRDGTKYPKCKYCATMLLNNSDPDTFVPILEDLDYPYIPEEWKNILEQAVKVNTNGVTPQSVIGKYISKMKLAQYKKYGYADSENLIREREVKKIEAYRDSGKSEEEIAARIADDKTIPQVVTVPAKEQTKSEEEEEFSAMPHLIGPEDEEEIIFTKEDKLYLAKKWGNTFQPKDYVYLEDFYQNMVKAYDISTPSHVNYLENICKVSLKMRQALEANDIESYNKLASTYDKLMKSAKFTAAQDKGKSQDFIDSIGEFTYLCEKHLGEIPRYDLKIVRDIPDKVLADYKRFVSILVRNESNLPDLIDGAIKAYERAQEDNDDEDIDEIFNEYDDEIFDPDEENLE